MELFRKRGVTGLPYNFPIQQWAGLFAKIKLKILPFKNHLSFCWMGKLSGILYVSSMDLYALTPTRSKRLTGFLHSSSSAATSSYEWAWIRWTFLLDKTNITIYNTTKLRGSMMVELQPWFSGYGRRPILERLLVQNPGPDGSVFVGFKNV